MAKLSFGRILVMSQQPPRKQYRKTYVREWRQHRDMTLEQLADMVDMKASALSYLERGQSGYTQGTMERIAAALRTDVPSLISRNPSSDPDAIDIADIMRGASPEQRAEIIGYAKGVTRQQ